MSTFIDVDITCEQCGHEFQGTVWTAVHAGQDPELKELLLGGELNMVMCPECSHVSYQERFVLYQDPDAELVAYVYPESSREDRANLKRMMMTGFREAQAVFAESERIDYEPILMFGLESLVEMMKTEVSRDEQSDVARELCREHDLATVTLRPSEARRLGVVSVLPRVGHNNPASRQEILDGISKLLSIDGALTVYEEVRQFLIEAPDWSLPAHRPSRSVKR